MDAKLDEKIAELLKTKEKIAELLEIVDRIAELTLELHDMGNQVAKIPWSEGQDNWRVMQARAELEIATAVDEKGKRLYSNENMRKAALTIWRAEHRDEFQIPDDVLAEHREMDRKYEALGIKRNRLLARKEILILSLIIETSIAQEDFLERVIMIDKLTKAR